VISMTDTRPVTSALRIVLFGVLLSIPLAIVANINPQLGVAAGPLYEIAAGTTFVGAIVSFVLSVVLLSALLWFFFRPSLLSSMVAIVSIALWCWFGWFFVMQYAV
jgi:hypothetical protein